MKKFQDGIIILVLLIVVGFIAFYSDIKAVIAGDEQKMTLQDSILFEIEQEEYLADSIENDYTKIFYDENWKTCSSARAKYYRLVNLDPNGKPTGMVRDYYMSGQIQWEGRITHLDPTDNSLDIIDGTCKWFFQNGNVSEKSYYKDGLLEGKSTAYFEDGTISGISNYSKGVLEGLSLEYYRSGEIRKVVAYKNGNRTDESEIQCLENEGCYYIMFHDFVNRTEFVEWTEQQDVDFEIKLDPFYGLVINNNSNLKYQIQSTKEISIPYDADFSIEAKFVCKSCFDEGRHGIVWGWKDWDNYSYFLISRQGTYSIGNYENGVENVIVNWTNSPFLINASFKENELRIQRYNGRTYFYINDNYEFNALCY